MAHLGLATSLVVAVIRSTDTSRKPLDCRLAVPTPKDTAPERSPQAVHTSLLHEFQGRDLAEIGTRNGDGMRCFAQVTRRAVAFEFDHRYCGRLQRYGGFTNFTAVCGDYTNTSTVSLLDADFITWWQQAPVLNNSDVLWHLREFQRKGRIRQSALAGGDHASFDIPHELTPHTSTTRVARSLTTLPRVHLLAQSCCST